MKHGPPMTDEELKKQEEKDALADKPKADIAETHLTSTKDDAELG